MSLVASTASRPGKSPAEPPQSPPCLAPSSSVKGNNGTPVPGAEGSPPGALGGGAVSSLMSHLAVGPADTDPAAAAVTSLLSALPLSWVLEKKPHPMSWSPEFPFGQTLQLVVLSRDLQSALLKNSNIVRVPCERRPRRGHCVTGTSQTWLVPFFFFKLPQSQCDNSIRY